MKRIALLPAAALLAFALAGCNGDDTSVPHESPPDSGTTQADSSTGGGDSGAGDSGQAGGEPDCYPNPKTHHEIINACTDAQAVDKKPVLPLLQPDGSLPPLP